MTQMAVYVSVDTLLIKYHGDTISVHIARTFFFLSQSLICQTFSTSSSSANWSPKDPRLNNLGDDCVLVPWWNLHDMTRFIRCTLTYQVYLTITTIWDLFEHHIPIYSYIFLEVLISLTLLWRLSFWSVDMGICVYSAKRAVVKLETNVRWECLGCSCCPSSYQKVKYGWA